MDRWIGKCDDCTGSRFRLCPLGAWSCRLYGIVPLLQLQLGGGRAMLPRIAPLTATNICSGAEVVEGCFYTSPHRPDSSRFSLGGGTVTCAGFLWVSSFGRWFPLSGSAARCFLEKYGICGFTDLTLIPSAWPMPKPSPR